MFNEDLKLIEFYFSLVAVGKDGRFIDCRQHFGTASDIESRIDQFIDDVIILNDDLKEIQVYIFGIGLVSTYCKSVK